MTDALVDRSSYPPGDAIIYRLNQMPITMLDFLQITGIDNRGYGVGTPQDNYSAPDQAEYDGSVNYYLTQRTRNAIRRMLLDIQETVFSGLDFCISPMYFKHTFNLTNPSGIYRLPHRYVSDLNVTYAVESVGSVTLSTFLEQNLTLTNVGSFIVADVADVDGQVNPDHIVFRKPEAAPGGGTKYEVKPGQKQEGLPRLTGGVWKIPIGNSVSSDTDTIHAQSMVMYVDIPVDSDEDINDLVLLHPGTKQIIPVIEKYETGGNWRLWYYAWQLKDPRYADQVADLEGDDFYRFYSSVDYGYIRDTHTIGTVQLLKNVNCGGEYDPNTTISVYASFVNQTEGTIRLDPVEILDGATTPPIYKYLSTWDGVPVTATVYYKADYDFGFLHISPEEMKRAIVAKVAAQLPHYDVLNNFDYIKQMREELPDTIFTPLGATVTKYQYGNRRGDAVFHDIMKNLSGNKSRVVRI